jgi:hypothetical protein
MAVTAQINALKCVPTCNLQKTLLECVFQLALQDHSQMQTLEYVLRFVQQLQIFMGIQIITLAYQFALQLQTSTLITQRVCAFLTALSVNLPSLINSLDDVY